VYRKKKGYDPKREFKLKRQITRVEFKPIFANTYTPHIYTRLGKKVLFTSATIVNATNQAKLLGIDPDKSVMVRVNYSNFPIVNRRIFLLRSIGTMNYQNKDSTYPRIAEELQVIMEHYKGMHGLILCYTNEMETALLEGFPKHPKFKHIFPNPLLARKYRSQITTHPKFSDERDRIISNFKKGLLPDGYDPYNKSLCQCQNCKTSGPFNDVFTQTNGSYQCSSCRADFHINTVIKSKIDKMVKIAVSCILKLPFQSLMDIQVAKRKDINSLDYTIKTIEKVLQMTGRTVRSDEDFSDIIIFDYAFSYMLQKHGYMIPKHIRDSIITVDRASDIFKHHTVTQQYINQTYINEKDYRQWLITTYGNEGEDFGNQIICENCFERTLVGATSCSNCEQPFGGAIAGRGKCLNMARNEIDKSEFKIQRPLNFFGD